jgi:hypothetical protein
LVLLQPRRAWRGNHYRTGTPGSPVTSCMP